MSKLKVLMLTRLFPSHAQPNQGMFCLERAKALAKHADVRVMSPIPYFPKGIPAPELWKRWSASAGIREFEGGIRASYHPYLSIPKIATFSQAYTMGYCVQQDYKLHYHGWKPDIIDAHFAFPDGYAGVELGKKIGCPTVITCHGADLQLYPEVFRVGQMLRESFQSASRVIAVSNYLKQRSLQLGCDERKSVFLTNGVDPDKFALRSKAECRQILGLPLDRKMGVYVGYLVDRKNQSLVIQAAAHIKQQGKTPPLIALVGDGENRQKLQQEVSELGLQDDVIFCGPKPHEEVALWMGAADWLLLSSRYEGWATVYFEALSCGRPVITTNVNSAKDAICQPEYGIVVEPYTSEAFAQALLEASEKDYDPQILRSYAEANSWARWAEKALDVFQQSIAEYQRN